MRENKVSTRTILKYLEIMAIIFLQGAPGKDHFNCGAGIDTITNFRPRSLIQRLQIVKIVSAFQLLQSIVSLMYMVNICHCLQTKKFYCIGTKN